MTGRGDGRGASAKAFVKARALQDPFNQAGSRQDEKKARRRALPFQKQNVQEVKSGSRPGVADQANAGPRCRYEI
jgi:hypothetical protein